MLGGFFRSFKFSPFLIDVSVFDVLKEISGRFSWILCTKLRKNSFRSVLRKCFVVKSLDSFHLGCIIDQVKSTAQFSPCPLVILSSEGFQCFVSEREAPGNAVFLPVVARHDNVTK